MLDQKFITSLLLESTLKSGADEGLNAIWHLASGQQRPLLCNMIALTQENKLGPSMVLSIGNGVEAGGKENSQPRVNWASALPLPLLTLGFQLTVSRDFSVEHPPLMEAVCGAWAVKNYVQSFMGHYMLLFGCDSIEKQSLKPALSSKSGVHCALLDYLYKDGSKFVETNKARFAQHRKRQSMSHLEFFIDNTVKEVAGNSEELVQGATILAMKPQLRGNFLKSIKEQIEAQPNFFLSKIAQAQVEGKVSETLLSGKKITKSGFDEIIKCSVGA